VLACKAEEPTHRIPPELNEHVMQIRRLFAEEVKHRESELEHSVTLTPGQKYVRKELRVVFGATTDEDLKGQINLLEQVFSASSVERCAAGFESIEAGAVEGIIASGCAEAFEVGVRAETFGQLTMPNSPYLTQLQSLIKNVDFIMWQPVSERVLGAAGIAASVNDVANQYASIKAAAQALNPSIEVLIGETGWPSQGVSFNNPDGSLNHGRQRARLLQRDRPVGNANQVQVMYFEAIDEPWKSNQNNTNPSDPKGFMGAEGHYGVWSYTTDDDSGSFVAKWTIGS